MSWIDLTASDAPREAPAFPLWEPPPSEAPTLDALCLDAIEAYRAALADAQDGRRAPDEGGAAHVRLRA